jgi:homoserine dehydrogenase
MSLSQPAHADRIDAGHHSVRIALLGCGTVGSGVANLLLHSASGIAARGGVPFSLEAVAVRHLTKPRPVAIPHDLLTADARAVIDDPAIDVIIECIGGLGVAAEFAERALRNRKYVVTANKELLATRGPELRALAAEHGVTIAYEAAVGGAIPIVRTISESLAGEEILEVGGVLNGTTNFILSEMFAGSTYDAALSEAKRRGFAEVDPTNDVEGIDAAHKLAILTQLGFRRGLVTSQIPRTGITKLTPGDVSLAKRLGMTIKLVACGRADASIVTPAYVRAEHPFAQPAGPQNCIRVIGRNSGSLTFAGTGAGGFPTASSVIGDVVATLHRIAVRRELSFPANASIRLAPVIDEPPIPLRRIVHLFSFRDARPARDALGRAGIESTLFENIPALLTVSPMADGGEAILAVLKERGIAPESSLPLWEDMPVPPRTFEDDFADVTASTPRGAGSAAFSPPT